ncbi:hypothetical protein EV1_025988 [Malus domestica]
MRFSHDMDDEYEKLIWGMNPPSFKTRGIARAQFLVLSREYATIRRDGNKREIWNHSGLWHHTRGALEITSIEQLDKFRHHSEGDEIWNHSQVNLCLTHKQEIQKLTK